MPLDNETRQLQDSLTHIATTGVGANSECSNDRRALVYHKLTRNNFEQTLQRTYPITHSILKNLGSAADSKALWEIAVDSFIASGKSQAPELWKMPKSFCHFCIENKLHDQFGIPFLDDLLYFEWMEIEVHMMPDSLTHQHRRDGCLDSDLIILNPHHAILKLDYPVFKTPPAEINNTKGNYFLLIFRDPKDESVRFVELSPLHTILIEELKAFPKNGGELLRTAIDTLKKAADEADAKIDAILLRSLIHRFLAAMLKERVILGFAE